MKLKVGIVDDEPFFLKQIRIMINKFSLEKHIPIETEIFNSGASILFRIDSDVYYDVYLLDIVLPNKNGLDIARNIRNRFPEAYIIFITSHTCYSLDAFELNVYRYIKKTKISEKLPNALNDIWKEVSLGEKESYVIDTCMRKEKILFKNIFYVFKENKYSVFVTSRGISKIRKALVKVYEELGNNDFILIDRGYIVNIMHIMKVVKNELTLRNGEIIIVSRTHMKEVKEKISYFWGKNL